MALNLRKLGIQGFKRIAIQSWNEGFIANWSKSTQRAWQHCHVDFNSKSKCLLWAFQGKPHFVLKLRKSRIHYFKQIVIQSWNEGDMVDWSKVAQRACNYGIECEPNCFWLFGLNFWASFWALFVAIRLIGFIFFFINPIFGYRAILVIWILSKF